MPDKEDPLNVCEAYLSIPAVSYIDAYTGKPEVEVCCDTKDQEMGVYDHRFIKSEPAEIVDIEFRLDDLFPKCELYTLFSGETKECLGLFRTQADADNTNKEWHKTDWRKFAVLRIDFNK